MPLRKMTLGEFLAWEEEQPERHEFYRGETFATVGSTARHNRVILNLASRIGDQLDGSPCQVFAEGMKVQVAEGILYPDVLVTCGKAGAGDEQIITDPKLVIEVQSPSTQGYDRCNKFILYRSLVSLRQYVLIDPVDRRVEVHTRVGEETWTLVTQSKAVTLTLECIGLELPMSAVFKGVKADAA